MAPRGGTASDRLSRREPGEAAVRGARGHPARRPGKGGRSGVRAPGTARGRRRAERKPAAEAELRGSGDLGSAGRGGAGLGVLGSALPDDRSAPSSPARSPGTSPARGGREAARSGSRPEFRGRPGLTGRAAGHQRLPHSGTGSPSENLAIVWGSLSRKRHTCRLPTVRRHGDSRSPACPFPTKTLNAPPPDSSRVAPPPARPALREWGVEPHEGSALQPRPSHHNPLCTAGKPGRREPESPQQTHTPDQSWGLSPQRVSDAPCPRFPLQTRESVRAEVSGGEAWRCS